MLTTLPPPKPPLRNPGLSPRSDGSWQPKSSA